MVNEKDNNELKLKDVEVKKNMLKERAKKADDITDEMFEKCNKENREMYKEFFSVMKSLSAETTKQYKTCLKQFFYFVYTDLNDKPINKVTKRDFMKYLAAMQERGLSSSAIGLRKSAVSSLCNYIENIVADDDPDTYGTFHNFTRGMPSIAKDTVYQKEFVNQEEYEKMKEYLLEKEKFLPLAWLIGIYHVGCRRAELIQFKTEILEYEIPEGANYIYSHVVRGKGPGVEGKPVRYMIPVEVLKYWKLWVDKRGYESEYIFTSNSTGEIKPIAKNWANRLCVDVLSHVIGRRITPHNFKASIATRLLEQGVDMAIVSKEICKHNDISVTQKFYDLRTFEEQKEDIFKNIKI